MPIGASHPQEAKRSFGSQRKVKLSDWQKDRLRQQNWRCPSCGADLSIVPWHLDHIHPKSRGGPEDPENFQILCAVCNLQKRAKFMRDWKPWLLKDGKPIVNWTQLGYVEPTVEKTEHTYYRSKKVRSRRNHLRRR